VSINTADLVNESRIQQVFSRVKVTLASGHFAYYPVRKEGISTDETIEHIVSSANFEINYNVSKLTYQTAEMSFHEFARIEWQTKANSQSTIPGYPVAIGVDWETQFYGFIKNITYGGNSCTLYCVDMLGILEKYLYDVGLFEADALKIDGLDIPPSPVPDDVSTGTFIQLKEIVEGDESRWVIPGNTNDNGAGSFSGTVYPEAYSGDTPLANESNRRQWRFIGRVWIEDMNLNEEPTDYGQDIEYPDPLPRHFYDIGGDLGSYLEFKDGYTPPVGKKVWIESAEVYIEGTNQLEDIFIQALNPRKFGRVTSVPDATTIVASRSRFIRDGIMVGGEIKKKGSLDSSSVKITDISDQTTIVTESAHGLLANDEFEIFNGVELSPLWEDTVHFNLSGGYGGSAPRTIWPSLITVNRFEWMHTDGSLLKMLETLCDEYAPPNYRPSWDHQYNKLRMQFREVTPYNTDSSYYMQESYPYGAFSVSSEFPDGYDGIDDYWTANSKGSISSELTDEVFASHIIVRGRNERPKNMLDDPEVKIISFPPGSTVSDFNHSAGVLSGAWNPIEQLGHHYSGENYYAKWHGASGNRALNVRDVNVDTIIGFENPAETGEGTLFAPIYGIDLGSPTRVGTIVLWGGNSWREFTWGVRVECCDSGGLSFDGTQYYPNTGAAWELMHPEYYAARIKPYERKELSGGWNTNYTRFILISMSHAKVQLEDWAYVGLSEIQVFAEDTVYGAARVEGKGLLCYSYLSSATWNEPIAGISLIQVTDVTKDFSILGVTPGDKFFDIPRGLTGTVVSVLGSELTLGISYSSSPDYANRVWRGDAYAIISQSAPAVGSWRYFADTEENDSIWLCNLPILHYQLKQTTGHQTMDYEDTSLSTSNMCGLRAAEILTETVRKQLSGSFKIAWHNSIRLYQTVKIHDPRTGIAFRGLVEGITREKGEVTISVQAYFPTTWTGEIPQGALSGV
jgi:hypothetical protein